MATDIATEMSTMTMVEGVWDEGPGPPRPSGIVLRAVTDDGTGHGHVELAGREDGVRGQTGPEPAMRRRTHGRDAGRQSACSPRACLAAARMESTMLW